ncbi:MAG: uracil-DNA glycosylase [Kiritimatiellia bacterium]
MDDFSDIIDDLIDHIRVLKELGIRTAEMDPQIVRDLEKVYKPLKKPGRPKVQWQRKKVEAAQGVKKAEGEALSRTFLQNSKPLTPAERTEAMQRLRLQISVCSACRLCANRRIPVTGQGNLNSPDVMFTGAAPSREDAESGEVFSGKTGELLTKMINAMGYKREDVFLTNTCKCPTSNPDSQPPAMDEMKKCSRFLEEEIKIIRPKTIVVMGEHANRGLFHNQRSALQPQGVWTQFHGIPVMPTFHPAYILRFSNDAEGQQKELKRSAWNALQAVMHIPKKNQ